MVKVISLGGSIVAPDRVDYDFLRDFRSALDEHLAADSARKIILVVGGGAPARDYQRAYRELAGDAVDRDEQDWIGIAATHLNGQLLRAVFRTHCPDPLVTDPTAPIEFRGRVLVAAGWKPGFSTDYDAVVLAERFGAAEVINLSNIERVYTADPRTNPSARPIDRIDWEGFRKIVGDVWNPGANLPFDPVAAKKAAELHLRVSVAAGRDIRNLKSILEGKPFSGTLIES